MEQLAGLFKNKDYVGVMNYLNLHHSEGFHLLPDEVKALIDSQADVEFFYYDDFLWCYDERTSGVSF